MVNHLQNYLKFLTNNVIVDNKQHYTSISALPSSISKKQYKIYILEKSKLTTEQIDIKESSKKISKNLDSKKQTTANILLLFLGSEKNQNTTSTQAFNSLDMSTQENPYFLFLEILKMLFPNDKNRIDEILTKFKQRYDSIDRSETTDSAYLLKQNKTRYEKIDSWIKLKASKYIYVLLMIGSIFITSIFQTKNSVIKQENTIASSIQSVINFTNRNIPKQENKFVGRDKLLKNLEKQLSSSGNESTNKVITITACAGLGGVGKTSLALQYIHHTTHPYTFKAWFPAETKEQIYETFLQFAKSTGYEIDHPSLEAVRDYVKLWLESNPGWLLVLDNVTNYKEIAPFLPKMGGHIIITTRYQEWPNTFYSLPIDVMSEKDAILLLETIIQHKDPKIKELAKELGYLPLALVQAGAYIQKNKKTISQYLDLYHMHEQKMLSDKTMLVSEKHVPVSVTWDTSLDAIEIDEMKDGHILLSRILLNVCSYLSPERIPRKFLLSWLKTNYPNVQSPEILLDKALGELKAYSLITLDPDGKRMSVHRLVQSTIRYNQSSKLDYNLFFLSFQRLLSDEEYKESTDFRKIDSLESGYDILPHFEAFLHSTEIDSFLNNDKELTIEIPSVIEYFAVIYREKICNLEKSIDLLIKARNSIQKIISSKDTSLMTQEEEDNLYLVSAKIDNDLGIAARLLEYSEPKTYNSLVQSKKINDTVQIFKNALTICKRECNSINTEIKHNLALTMMGRNNFSKAKEYLLDILASAEEKESANYVRSLANLGYISSDLQEYKTAEQYLHKAEAILKDKELTRTSEMGTIYYFLGYHYNRIGYYDLAIKYLLEAHEIKEDISLTHLYLIKINNELGMSYEKQGRIQDAINCYNKALYISRNRLGDDHEDSIKLKQKLLFLKEVR